MEVLNRWQVPNGGRLNEDVHKIHCKMVTYEVCLLKKLNADERHRKTVDLSYELPGWIPPHVARVR